MTEPKHDQDQTDIGTTGHSWDGIEELNNPLPRWWLWTFYITIAFSVLWVILYPAIPLVHHATQGLLGYDSREVVQEKINTVNAENAPFNDALVNASYAEIKADEALDRYAIEGGGSIFATYCSQCHGSGGQGAKGYPNLLDNDWLWGGTYEAIETTILHGVRDETDPDTRFSEMPAFADALSGAEIDAVVNYIMSLSETPQNADLVAQGEVIFMENCASCHGENAMGNQELGAPNLTDAIWLFGGDFTSIEETIRNGRKQMMPHWGERLDGAQIKQIVTYVHQLGGGQ